jgi:hypothetical protein
MPLPLPPWLPRSVISKSILFYFIFSPPIFCSDFASSGTPASAVCVNVADPYPMPPLHPPKVPLPVLAQQHRGRHRVLAPFWLPYPSSPCVFVMGAWLFLVPDHPAPDLPDTFMAVRCPALECPDTCSIAPSPSRVLCLSPSPARPLPGLHTLRKRMLTHSPCRPLQASMVSGTLSCLPWP